MLVVAVLWRGSRGGCVNVAQEYNVACLQQSLPVDMSTRSLSGQYNGVVVHTSGSLHKAQLLVGWVRVAEQVCTETVHAGAGNHHTARGLRETSGSQWITRCDHSASRSRRRFGKAAANQRHNVSHVNCLCFFSSWVPLKKNAMRTLSIDFDVWVRVRTRCRAFGVFCEGVETRSIDQAIDQIDRSHGLQIY